MRGKDSSEALREDFLSLADKRETGRKEGADWSQIFVGEGARLLKGCLDDEKAMNGRSFRK